MNADARPAALEVDRHLGARLREARLQRGWSQELLADALGISFQQVQKYERAANRVAASRLWQIALALDLPVAWFFEDLPAAPGAAPPPELLRPRQSLELLRHYEALTPALRADLLNVVKAIAAASGQEVKS